MTHMTLADDARCVPTVALRGGFSDLPPSTVTAELARRDHLIDEGATSFTAAERLRRGDSVLLEHFPGRIWRVSMVETPPMMDLVLVRLRAADNGEIRLRSCRPTELIARR